MSKDKTLVLGYRVTPERRKQLKQWAAEHDTTFQAMVEEALEILLNPPIKEPSRPLTDYFDPIAYGLKPTESDQPKSEKKLHHPVIFWNILM